MLNVARCGWGVAVLRFACGLSGGRVERGRGNLKVAQTNTAWLGWVALYASVTND